MRQLLAPLAGVFLCACGTLLPPRVPSGVAWGIPYAAQIVPDGSLDPYGGYATGYRVQIEQAHVGDVFLLAHELTHVHQWHHRTLKRDWAGVPCAVQPAGHCKPREAHADAVAVAVLAAGCAVGDLGWPGGAVTGCTLPDPAKIHP